MLQQGFCGKRNNGELKKLIKAARIRNSEKKTINVNNRR